MLPLDYKIPSSFSNFYFVNIIIPVFVAPIIEEIRFRGFLTNNRLFSFLFLLLTPLGLLLGGWNFSVFIFCLLIYVLFFIQKITKSELVLDIFIFTSALFFGISHLPLGESLSFDWFPFLAISFSIALILSWVIINKSIWWAILFHGSWNLILGIIFLLGLQFVTEDLEINEGEGYKIEWKRVPFLDSNIGTYKPKENALIINNMNLQDVFGIVDPSVLDSFLVVEPFMKYDIKLETSGGYDSFRNNLIDALESDSLLLRKKGSRNTTDFL